MGKYPLQTLLAGALLLALAFSAHEPTAATQSGASVQIYCQASAPTDFTHGCLTTLAKK